jgi:hypothetical protein
MKMSDSQRLLADYADTGAEPAFRKLLARYVDLVYSTAVRLVGGDAHLAQDVTRIVFADLAGKAKTLRQGRKWQPPPARRSFEILRWTVFRMIYKERWKLFGEEAAAQWVIGKYGRQ